MQQKTENPAIPPCPIGYHSIHLVPSSYLIHRLSYQPPPTLLLLFSQFPNPSWASQIRQPAPLVKLAFPCTYNPCKDKYPPSNINQPINQTRRNAETFVRLAPFVIVDNSLFPPPPKEEVRNHLDFIHVNTLGYHDMKRRKRSASPSTIIMKRCRGEPLPGFQQQL